jgi:hypothetical protein
LVVASVSNNNALSFDDKSSSKFQLVVASVTNECSKGSAKKTAQCTMNNSRQSRSFIDDVSIDSWQCPMKIDEVNFQQVGNSASTELVGSCHNKKLERVGNSASTQTQLVGSCHDKKLDQVGNSASTQLVGFCHDNKSEQVTCSEQEHDANHPSKIHDPSNTKSLTNNLRQCQTFVNNVSIDSWQCRMEIDDVKSQSIKWQYRIYIVDLKSERVGNCASNQLVGSCHDEK